MYKLPPNIAAALVTNRKELLYLQKNDLDDGELKEVMKLLGDLIEDRYNLNQKCMILQDYVKNVLGNIKELQNQIIELQRITVGSYIKEEK